MSDMALEYKLREFTVDEYHRLAGIGLFRPDERVELLDGAIVEMSPIGNRHWRLHGNLSAYLAQTLGSAAFIVPQGSFPLGTKSEPQPDLAILAPQQGKYGEPGPTPDEIYAVIELADSSLRKRHRPEAAALCAFRHPGLSRR